MTVYDLQNLFSQYGIIILSLLVFVEYLSIPGYPGGAVLPLMGVMAQFGVFPFWKGYLAALVAAVASFTVVYWVGYLFNKPVTDFFSRRKKTTVYFQRIDGYLQRFGNSTLFFSRLMPVIRSFISIPAGVLKMNFWVYFLLSLAGTVLFILMMMGAGFFFTGLFV